MTTPIDSRDDSRLHRLTIKLGGFGRPLAGKRWFRLYGLLRHVGRRSGKAYEIPIVALPFRGGFMIPLPFGESTQWLKNIEAADQAGLRHAGHDYVIDRPEVVDLATAKPHLPGWVGFVAGRVGIAQFVRVRQVSRA